MFKITFCLTYVFVLVFSCPFWPASRFICNKATTAYVTSAEAMEAQIEDIWSKMFEIASPTAYISIYVWFAVVALLLYFILQLFLVFLRTDGDI